MAFPRLFLSPNQHRLLYDSAVSAGAALFVALFAQVVPGLHSSFVLALAPFLVVGLNWAGGIYGRYRIGSGRVKAPILAGVTVTTAFILWLMSGLGAESLLWAVLVIAPLVMPRVFLNLNQRTPSSYVSLALKDRGPVLVVGGGGYIGSHVVDLLLKEGYPVRIFDRFIYGRNPIQEFQANPHLEIIEGDITDIMKLTEAMSGTSAVVHLAGLVGDPACAVDEVFTRHTNVIATRMLKEIAMSLGVPRFVFASSCSVYGASDEEVDESSPLNPVSLYANTKIDSEQELLSRVDETLAVTVLRFATVFGHSRRPRFDLVANLFTAQAINEGKITVTGENQWRPFVHVRDLARAIVTVLKAKAPVVHGQTFNVGDSRLNMTIGQLAQKVQKIVAEEHPVEIVVQNNVSDRRNYLVSFNKIRRVLGFEASTLMEDGIREMVQEFKKGTYHHYRDAIYSNLEMTRRALEDFRDPTQSSRLYGPLTEDQPHSANRVANA